MIAVDRATAARWRARLIEARVGPAAGLLFLIGPLSDLADDPDSAARTAAIAGFPDGSPGNWTSSKAVPSGAVAR